MEYMVGLFKFNADTDDQAVLIAKKEMLKHGWRNLRLLKKGPDGWEVCRVIPSFETMPGE